MASDPTNLFDASFTVQRIDPDGKKFDRGEHDLHSANCSILNNAL